MHEEENGRGKRGTEMEVANGERVLAHGTILEALHLLTEAAIFISIDSRGNGERSKTEGSIPRGDEEERESRVM